LFTTNKLQSAILSSGPYGLRTFGTF